MTRPQQTRGFVPYEPWKLGRAQVAASWQVGRAAGEGVFPSRDALMRFLREFYEPHAFVVPPFAGVMLAYATDARGEFTIRVSDNPRKPLVLVEEASAEDAA